MPTTRAIAICGQIGSGKSSIIRALSKTYGWDIVSFGDYVKSQIAAKNPNRDNYQSLGETLFASRGPKGLLEDAIRFSNPSSNTLLIDGVRHVSIVAELRRAYGDTVILFLEVSDNQRYERFLKRNDDAAPISYDEFMQLGSHPIEQGIPDLARVADTVIDGNVDFDGVLSKILEYLNQ